MLHERPLELLCQHDIFLHSDNTSTKLITQHIPFILQTYHCTIIRAWVGLHVYKMLFMSSISTKIFSASETICENKIFLSAPATPLEMSWDTLQDWKEEVLCTTPIRFYIVTLRMCMNIVLFNSFIVNTQRQQMHGLCTEESIGLKTHMKCGKDGILNRWGTTWQNNLMMGVADSELNSKLTWV